MNTKQIFVKFLKKQFALSWMMFQPKMKENCQPQPSDSKKSLSPAYLKTRANNCKEGGTKGAKIQKEIPVIPIKRRPNQPSKSSIQSQENKHYNSPNSAIPPHPESRTIHQFTFTQLLNQNHPISQQRLPQIMDPAFQPPATYISDPAFKIKESMMRKAALTSHGLAHTNPSFSREGDEQLAKTDFFRQSGLNHQEISNEDRRSENKSNSHSQGSKSPIRMTNVHKLNNTPKLKDRSGKTNKHQKISSKTFTAILNSSELPLPCAHHAKQDSINLLCSEKIYKFRDSNPVERQKEPSPKRKSNLQSTGIINLSQPLEGSQPSHYYPFSQFTKETSEHRVQINRIISQSDSIKQFQEEEQDLLFNDDVFPKIEELKMKVSEVSNYLKNQLQLYDQTSFSEDICSNFNPELKHYDISGPIEKLTQLSGRIQSVFQDLIEKILRASFVFEERIRDDIKTIEQSQISLINWTEVERGLKEKQFFEGWLCKNEIMSLRLQALSKVGLHLRDENINEGFSERNLKLTEFLTELNSINRELGEQIKQIFVFNQTSQSSNVYLGHSQVAFFRGKTIQLQNLQQCIDELLVF